MKKGYDIEDKEFKKLVGTGNSNVAACVATAGVSLLVGFVILLFYFLILYT